MTPWDQLYYLKGKVSERSDYSWTLSRLASCTSWQVTLLNKARDMGPSSFQIPGRFQARDRLFPLTFPLLSTALSQAEAEA